MSRSCHSAFPAHRAPSFAQRGGPICTATVRERPAARTSAAGGLSANVSERAILVETRIGADAPSSATRRVKDEHLSSRAQHRLPSSWRSRRREMKNTKRTHCSPPWPLRKRGCAAKSPEELASLTPRFAQRTRPDPRRRRRRRGPGPAICNALSELPGAD